MKYHLQGEFYIIFPDTDVIAWSVYMQRKNSYHNKNEAIHESGTDANAGSFVFIDWLLNMLN